MNGMEGIFGIIGIGAGLYSLYAWFQLKFKGIINTSILVPKDTNIKKCKDKEAYRAAAGPKLLVLAVVLILYGAEDLYNTYVQSTGKLFWVMLVLVLAVLVWFAWTVKKLMQSIFKIRSQNKGKGKVQTKRAAPSYFIWRKNLLQ